MRLRMDQMKPFETGLRCQDVHAGLRGVDPNSAPLAHLEDTRLVGMAASLAAAIRGQDIVRDAQALKVVAADQLDVDSLAFNQVIELLDEAGFVSGVKRQGGKIQNFTEQVPFHQDLYSRLGEVWADREPTEVEGELLHTVHRLAAGPLPAEELADAVGIEPSDQDTVLTIARESDLVKSLDIPDGEILYSPFMGFEDPGILADIFAEHGSERFQEELAQARAYQGLPVDEQRHPALEDAIARGLLMAPSVRRPEGLDQPFAFIPYTLDRDLLTIRKAVFEKAMAIVACVRCGQHFGGATNIGNPLWILDTLLDPTRSHALAPHSSHRRQYQLLFRMQVMDFEPSGNWVRPRLIATEDNLAAVKLARDLITVGEPLEDRLGDTADARQLLLTEGQYLTPLQTVHRRRHRVRLSDKEYAKTMDHLMGRAPL
jgi:hypothetical protein